MTPRPIPARPSRYPGEFLLAFQGRPIALLREAARLGDVVRLRGRGADAVFLVSHADLIREVLVTQAASFKKGRALENARRFLGDGLLTSEGAFHRGQRRMMQPAFHRRQIARYAEVAAAGARRAAGERRAGERFDALDEMMRATMPIVTGTLFGASLTPERAARVAAALGEMVRQFRLTLLPGAALLERLPLPSVRRLRAAEALLHETVAAMIAERRAEHARQGGEDSGDDDDLLGLLIDMQDEDAESGGAAAAAMSDQQIHDEVLTLFIAGHETTSVWLAWTWYLLATHPDVEARLRAELAAALQGRAPGYDDLPSLPYTRQVLSESLRLYPPAWAVGRRCLTDVTLGDYEPLPAGSIVIVSQAVTHVDSRYWPGDPLAFRPERWADAEASAARPKFAFFPFGGGPRVCIGEQFAWMEATLLLATLAQAWRLELAPGARVTTRPAVTLRPGRGGIPVRVELI